MESELRLRIVLLAPPAGVDIGLQEGSGSTYRTIQRQRSRGGDLVFQGSVRAKDDRKDGQPNFLGELVQGPRDARFLYLDIGRYAGQENTPWSRRIKIPLGGITWELIHRAAADPRTFLEARLPGTGKDGGPSCATVKPLDGWKLGRERP